MASYRFENKKVTVNRTIPCMHLLDNYMSFRAKGVLSLLYAIGTDSEITMDYIAKVTTDSKGAIAAALKELQLLGYIKRYMKRDEFGRFSGVEYYVFVLPVERTPGCITSNRNGKNGSFQG